MQAMAQSIFIQKTTDILPNMTPAQEVVNTASSGVSGTEILLLIIGAIVAFFVIRWIARLLLELWLARYLVYIQVSVPRSDSKLDKEHETKKDFKEKAGIMSLVHNSIWKVPSTSLKYTVLNAIFNHIKFSYEIIYKEGQVFFFIVTYRDLFPTINQTITSIYPDAEVVIRDKKDYISFEGQHSVVRTTSFGKDEDKYFPIKTYKYFEEDPLTTFTNVFGGLKQTDVAVFQVTAKPLSHRYNKKAKKVAGEYSKGKYNRGGSWLLSWGLMGKLLAPLGWIVTNFVQNKEDANPMGASGGDSYKIFNQAEQEAQKMVGENAAQNAFEASMIVLVGSDTESGAQNGIDSMLASTSVYTNEYCNNLDNNQILEGMFRPIVRFLHKMAFRFKLAGFVTKMSPYSVDELTTLYHFPDINYNKSPIIYWLGYKKVAPPSNLKMPTEKLMMIDYVREWDYIITEDGTRLKTDKFGNIARWPNDGFLTADDTEIPLLTDGDKRGQPIDEGKLPKSEETERKLGGFSVYKDSVLLGWNEYRNKKQPVYFDKKDRGRHHYIIGKSWGGKSVLIGYLARQDLWNGEGICVIDPHGDLIEDILAFTPKDRARDMVIFDPSDYERPMGLNMLEVISTDPDLRAIEKDRASLDATAIFIKIFGDEIFGPRIQHYFRNGALTLMDDEEDGGTLIDVPRLFVDESFLKYKVSKIKNPVVKAFWEHEYAQTGDREKQEMIPYFSAKFGPFITNTTIRNIIGQPKSAFNIREIMDNQRCLMVNLSKGKIGDLNAQLLGLVFVSKVNLAAMSRADMAEKDRKDFFFYVDEFQNFATDTFGEILSEARKYKLALIMAHQYIAQIWGSGEKYKSTGKPSIKEAVFGNVGTIMSFKVGAEDAEYLEKEYAPTLSQQDIIGIANYTTYCKLNIDNASTRPFDIKTIWDNYYRNDRAAEIIKEYSRKMYARKKQYVDMEIEARLGITGEEIPENASELPVPTETVPAATPEAWTDTPQAKT